MKTFEASLPVERDHVWCHNVTMNIIGRATLAREVARVLRRQGRFSCVEIAQVAGERPLPLFAATEETALPIRNLGRDARSKGPESLQASEARAMALPPEMPLGEHVVEDYATLSLTLKRHPLAFLRADLAREGLVTAADLAHLPVDQRLSIAGVVLIRQRPGSANGVVFITIEDETGIADLIVWPKILERFRRAALGATLLRCTGKLQREESVIHVVADHLDDLTPRLNTLRDRGDVEPARAPKPPFASSAKPPGYDPREIVIASRDFR